MLQLKKTKQDLMEFLGNEKTTILSNNISTEIVNFFKVFEIICSEKDIFEFLTIFNFSVNENINLEDFLNVIFAKDITNYIQKMKIFNDREEYLKQMIPIKKNKKRDGISLDNNKPTITSLSEYSENHQIINDYKNSLGGLKINTPLFMKFYKPTSILNKGLLVSFSKKQNIDKLQIETKISPFLPLKPHSMNEILKALENKSKINKKVSIQENCLHNRLLKTSLKTIE